MANRQSRRNTHEPEIVAGNGLIDRRALLGRGMRLRRRGRRPASARRSPAPPPSRCRSIPGAWRRAAPIPAYGAPSKYESKVVRTLTNPKNEPRTSKARTPHHLLNGTITPNGLHFVVSRTGFPDIDPAKHRLAIHGLVKQPLVFTLDALARYPMVSRIHFVECGGNSAPLYSKDPVQANVQAIHGLLSCSEWTGVRLSTLLEETGIDPKAKWLLAEGADGPSMNRSIPLAKALDDAMIALYQNGERISSVERLSDAAAGARLRRQHERQMAAPDQAHRRAGHGHQRDPAIHLSGGRAENLAVLLPDGGQVLHHPARRPA